MKKAICFGINNYPGTANDLSGCVNDANDWADLLENNFDFHAEVYVDQDVTRSWFRIKVVDLLVDSEPGDVLVVTYSGHGTNIQDTSGDEADGYDEALYLYDGILLDDEIRWMINDYLQDGVNLTLIIDSCFSGTVTRIAGELEQPRFYQHELSSLQARNQFLTTEDNMPEILLTGCTDTEYSYDAFIDGRWNGAFTRYAIDTINEGVTDYDEFILNLQTKLPSQKYPQSPQLECRQEVRQIGLFTPLIIEPAPEPEPSGCFTLLQGLINKIKA